METSQRLQPTGKNHRIDLIDIYRGFAILGIFVVNIVIMNSTFLNQEEFAKQWTSSLDQFAERFLQLFFYTKFFPIFSLLFGLGISMQVLKIKAKGPLSFSFFARRMGILFFFGVCHIVFLWSGDVLNLYALLGLLVTIFIGRSNKLILVLSGFFLLFPFYDQVFFFFINLLNFDPGSYLAGLDGTAVREIITEGSYIKGIKLRLKEYMANIPILFGFLAPIALSMFLLGLYLGKNKIYKSLDTFISQITVPVVTITIISNIYRIAFLFFLPEYDIYSNEAFKPYFIKLMVVSDVFMGLFYLWILGWIWYNTKFNFLLKPLRHVGRMALTNYLMQSAIGLFLFSSLGLELYETLSPIQTLMTAVAVFSFQVIFSMLWLTYFRFGPLEWLWRCLTYKKLFSIRKIKGNPLPEMKVNKG